MVLQHDSDNLQADVEMRNQALCGLRTYLGIHYE